MHKMFDLMLAVKRSFAEIVLLLQKSRNPFVSQVPDSRVSDWVTLAVASQVDVW